MGKRKRRGKLNWRSKKANKGRKPHQRKRKSQIQRKRKILLMDLMNFDHQMVLNEKDEIISFLKKQGQPFFTMAAEPTAENMARVIFDVAQKEGLPVAAVQVWETPNSSARFSSER